MSKELTKEQKILVLDTKIAERALIVYVLESSLLDESDSWPLGYKTAIEDEIQNHNTAIAEYKEELKQLNTTNPINTDI